jgi:PKD repeat protein
MKLHYPIFILFAVVLIGCKKELPVASFTFSPAAPKVGETVTFTNSSKNATGYQWNFGDGGTSQSENPTHTFTTNGNFDVHLTATGEDGTDSYSATVPLEWPAPVAAFTMDKTETDVDEVITFTNQSENAVSYLWSFGDGVTSTVTNPTHSYAMAGIYTVQLTVAGKNEGTDTYSSAVSIYYAPVADFIMDKTEAKTGETINFTNQSVNATSYLWKFGDGSTSTSEDAAHSWTSGGIYSVQLIANGPGGKDTISKKVTINEVNIFPGVGVRDIELLETWATIENKIGDLAYQLYYIDNEDYILHIWESESLGIVLFLVSPTNSYTPSSADILWLIGMHDNYVGMTEEEIRIGSLRSDVVDAYGEPDVYNPAYNAILYASLGIGFYFNESNMVDQMTVFLDDTKKGSGLKYPASNQYLKNILTFLKQ